MKRYCKKCGREWNISQLKRVGEWDYVCPECADEGKDKYHNSQNRVANCNKYHRR
jgi:hypothetical protein